MTCAGTCMVSRTLFEAFCVPLFTLNNSGIPQGMNSYTKRHRFIDTLLHGKCGSVKSIFAPTLLWQLSSANESLIRFDPSFRLFLSSFGSNKSARRVTREEINLSSLSKVGNLWPIGSLGTREFIVLQGAGVETSYPDRVHLPQGLKGRVSLNRKNSQKAAWNCISARGDTCYWWFELFSILVD